MGIETSGLRILLNYSPGSTKVWNAFSTQHLTFWRGRRSVTLSISLAVTCDQQPTTTHCCAAV